MKKRLMSILLSVAMIFTMAPYLALPYTLAYAETDESAAPAQEEMVPDGEAQEAVPDDEAPERTEQTEEITPPGDTVTPEAAESAEQEEEEPLAAPQEDETVAKIGDTEYTSLEAAVEAAAAGDTITLVKSIYREETLTIDKKLTLDLSGKTIDTESYFRTGEENPVIMVTETGDLTITDPAADIEHAGSIVSDFAGVVTVDGTLTVKNGNLMTDSGTAVYPRANSHVIIDGGYIVGTDSPIRINYAGAVVDVKDGIIEGNGAITITEGGATVNITGGSVYAGTSSSATAIMMMGDSVVNISDGYIASNGTAIETLSFSGGEGTVNISGGLVIGCTKALEFTGAKTVSVTGGEIYGEIASDTEGFIAGGTFKLGNPLDPDDEVTVNDLSAGTYLAEGYTQDPATGKVKSDAVAVIERGGETIRYTSLPDAVAAAQDGETVTLIEDTEITERLNVSGKSITLDLGKYDVSGTVSGESGTRAGILVEEGAALTITGTTGTFSARGEYDYDVLWIKGSVIIEGGNIKGHLRTVWIDGNGKLTINGGTLSASDNYAIWVTRVASAPEVVINGGTISVPVPQEGSSEAINIQTGKLTITGGEISGKYSVYNHHEKVSEDGISITGGTFHGTVNVTDCTKFIKGGVYDTTLDTTYLADGYVQDTEGATGAKGEVLKDEPVITLSSAGKTYDGEDALDNLAVTVKTVPGVDVSADAQITWTKDGEPVTSLVDAGTYVMTAVYQGKTGTAEYTIAPANLSDYEITVNDTAYCTYAPAPLVRVANGDKVLTQGKDFDVTTDGRADAGESAVTVTGKGNYTGSVQKTLTIQPRALTDENVTFTLTPDTYEVEVPGTECKPAVTGTLKYLDANGEEQTYTLQEGTDYTVTYDGADKVGTVKAIITAPEGGNFSGTAEKEYTINAPFVATVIAADGTETQYSGFKEAVDAAKSGETVKVYGNCSTGTISLNKAVIIDLNGCTVSSTTTMFLLPRQYGGPVNGKVTVRDTSAGNSGKMTSTAYVFDIEHGEVILEGGTLEASGNAVIRAYTAPNYFGKGDVTVREGAKIVAKGGTQGIRSYGERNHIFIEGGTVTAENGNAIYYNELTVSGGEISTTGTGTAVGGTIASTFVMTGGTVSAPRSRAVSTTESSNVTCVVKISGGTITGNQALYIYNVYSGSGTAFTGGQYSGSVTLCSGAGKSVSGGTFDRMIDPSYIATDYIQDEATFAVLPETPHIVLSQESVSYDGEAHEPVVSVVYNSGRDVTEAAELVWTYDGEVVEPPFTEVGLYTVTSTYEGLSDSAVYRINEKGIDDLYHTWSVDTSLYETFTYTGYPITPEIPLYDEEGNLVEGVTYTTTIENNVNAGTATFTLTGTGIYSGTIQGSFKIEPADLADEDVTYTITPDPYPAIDDETPCEPTVTAVLKSKAADGTDQTYTLIEGTDYTVSYLDNYISGETASTGRVMILPLFTGANFKNAKELTFSMNPAVAKINRTEGDVFYTSFEDAINDVKNGETIVMIRDTMVGDNGAAVDRDGGGDITFTLDLNGHIITKNSTGFDHPLLTLRDRFYCEPAMILKDSSDEQTGKIIADYPIYMNGTALTVESGTIESTGRLAIRMNQAPFNYYPSELTVKGGRIIGGDGCNVIGTWDREPRAIVNLEGGEIIANGSGNAIAIYTPDYASINIKDGAKVMATGTGDAIAATYWSSWDDQLNINIEGGEISAAAGDCLSLRGAYTAQIKGGTFYGTIDLNNSEEYSSGQGVIEGGIYRTPDGQINNISSTGFIKDGYAQYWYDGHVGPAAMVVTVDPAEAVYSGQSQTPAVTAKDPDGSEPFDTTFVWTRDGEEVDELIDAGTYTVEADSGGTKGTATFKILPLDISDCEMQLSSDRTFTGYPYSIFNDVTVKKDDSSIALGRKDFDVVSVANATEPGTMTVTIEGKGNTTGELSAATTIGKADFDDIEWTLEYDSVPLDPLSPVMKPSVTGVLKTEGNVFTDGQDLAYTVPESDYKVTYEDNDAVGTATVIITNNNGDRYEGTAPKELTFEITDSVPVAIIKRFGVTDRYLTLAEAVEAAQDGETIELVKDFSMPNHSEVSITEKDVTLDLAGHTVTLKGLNNGIIAGGNSTLTIMDSSEEKTGTIAAAFTPVKVQDAGTLIVESGNLTGTLGIGVDGGGILTVNGGYIEATAYSAISMQNKGTTCPVITINDGTIKGAEAILSDPLGSSRITINGGIMTSTKETSGFIRMAAGNTKVYDKTIAINGGTVTVPGTLFDIDRRSRQNIEIDIAGGSLTSTGAPAIDLTAAKTNINISGGTIRTEAEDAYAIRIANHESYATGTALSITGGTIIGTAGAVQSESQEAFITGGYYSHEPAAAYVADRYAARPAEEGAPAAYTIRPVLTVPYDANGGTGQMESAEVVQGDKLLLPGCGFTPPYGKKFAGWQVDGTVYKTGEEAATQTTAPIKAVWTARNDYYLPIAVESGFNRDGVVENQLDISTGTSAGIDGGGCSFFAIDGKNGSLPLDGFCKTSETSCFQMAPYTGPNTLVLESTGQTGTLTFAEEDQKEYTKLVLLLTGGSSGGLLGVTVNMEKDGEALTYSPADTIRVLDWYQNEDQKVVRAGRTSRSSYGGWALNQTEDFGMYASYIELPEEYKGATVKSVTLRCAHLVNYNSTLCVFAVSGVSADDTYTVFFNDPEKKVETVSAKAKDGEEILLPDGEKERYHIEGWYDGDQKVGKPGDSYKVATSLDLTAKWEEDAHIIADPNHDDLEPYKIYADADGHYVPEERQYYDFLGWAETGSGPVIEEESLESGHTYYAQWKQQEATVTFAAGGESGSMQPAVVGKGEKLKLPDNGFTAEDPCNKFAGWQVGDEIKAEKAEITVTEDMTVTATWQIRHTPVHHEAAAATCTAKGNTEYWSCDVCGKAFSDEGTATEIPLEDTVIEIDASAHDFGEWQTMKEAACTENGVRYRVCSRNGMHIEMQPIEATGHNLSKVEAKPAGCEENGNREYYVCDACGKYFSDAEGKTEIAEADIVIAATGHAWGETETVNEATCTAYGLTRRVCANDSTHIDFTVIEPTGHNLTHVAAKDATCTENGAIEHWYCDKCGGYFSDAEGKTEIKESEAIIFADGHNMTRTPAKAATCTEAGNIEYWYCETCEKYFSDAEGSTEIAEADTVTEVQGHSLIKVEAKTPTHKTLGNIEYYKCSVCGELFLDAEGEQPATEDDVLLKRGWLLEDAEWYFYVGEDEHDKGTKLCNAWASDSVGWCWLDDEGRITKDKWIKDNGEWYYLKANGYMAANEWAKDNKGWLYMEGSGKAAKAKWIQYKGTWYYMKANGYMAASEWAKDSKGWLYMEASGKAAKAKWIQDKGSWYYLDASGYMVTGTQTINGKTYRFDSSGKWIQ